MDTFYTPGAKGYTDYPSLEANKLLDPVSLENQNILNVA
jgi:hypothetical protein